MEILFMLFESDFCDEHTCSLGRSSRSSIAAVVLFLLAGLLMFFTKDWPGRDDGGTMQDPNPQPLAYVVPEVQTVVVDDGMADMSPIDDSVPAVKAQTY